MLEVTPALLLSVGELAEALRFLSRSLALKSTNPSLACIIFPGDGAALAGNALQRAIWRFEGAAEHPGFAIPHASLKKLIAGVGKTEAISFTLKGEHILVTVDGITSKIKAASIEEFPASQVTGDAEYRTTLDAQEFHAALSFTAPCISMDETRFYLNGIYIHPRDGHLALVATDGHKMGFTPTAAAWVTEENLGRIVPHPAITALLASLKGCRGNLTLETRERTISVSHENWTLESEVIDGTFPDYRRIFPKKHNIALNFPIASTLPFVKRLQNLSELREPNLLVDSKAGIVEIADISDETHRANIEFTVTYGDGLRCSVNAAHLREALETFETAGAEIFNITTIGPNEPLVVQHGEALWLLVSKGA